ncbi:hypothetical protein LA080_003816 [Diaporthe eres]|nr:hypothetical protein LA080_003816 [Diaporthe eres]
MSTSNNSLSFRHEPLQHPRSHIRLLEVLLVDNSHAIDGIEVHCQLTTHRFTPGKKSRSFFNTESEELTPLYHAISDVWGRPDDMVTILVSDKQMEVRRNCEYALKQSAWHGAARYIWCDAICIDQTNDDEKGHQVYMMGDIYRNAQGVLACVGPHSRGSQILLQALRTHASTMSRIAASATDDRCEYSRSPWSIFASQPTDGSPKWSNIARRWAWQEDANLDALIPAMKEFLDRDYFSRTWVYQEIVLRRHIILCCGCTRTPLYSLYGIFLIMEYLGHLSVRDTEKAWPLLRAGAFSWSRSEKSLETLMGDVLALDCADPRDKVYSVLSMVHWRRRSEEPIYPDYTLDTHSLASKVLPRILRQRGESRLDLAWEKLHMLSDNLRLCNRASGLDDAISQRRFCPQLMDRNWPYLGLTAVQHCINTDLRCAGFQLDRKVVDWSFRNAVLKYSSFNIFQFPDFEAEYFETDLVILLPEVASSGDWCLLPYCDSTDDPIPLILVVRHMTGKYHKIVGKALGLGQDVLWQFAARQHDFLVRFGSEDLLVLFNQGDFSTTSWTSSDHVSTDWSWRR